MPKSADIDSVNDALRARLQVVLHQHSQAEVSRRTGHSLSNVNRYATGTRMPGSFIAALVTELGVNPTWLLTGEGEPHRSDISGKTEERAVDLLEIVKAMSAVTQMRLGSLTTRHHLKVLKELNEAFNRYEVLQKRLNEHSRELFAHMMDDLAAALDNMDLDRAERLRESAMQVSKLCDDFELNYNFFQLQARIEYGKGRAEKAAELMRKQFLFSMMRVGKMESRDLDNIMRFAVSVASQDRVREGMRAMRSALEQLSDEQRKWPQVPYIQFLLGHYTGLVGDLRGGLAEMQRHFPNVQSESRRTVCETYLVNAMLYSRLVNVDGAIAFGSTSEAKAKWIIDFCAVMEDVPNLAKAIKYYETPPIEPVKGQGSRAAVARIILKAMTGDSKAALAEWKPIEDGLKRDAITQFHGRVVRCQLNRAAHAWKKAIDDALEADAMRSAMDPEISIGPLFDARHHASVLKLHTAGKELPDELVAKATAYFRRMYEGGYIVFHEFANPPT
ncbi:MAG: helix-turn-helix transcriptional regulator [Planctomycetes bacterium]|nr:helix-turn-helix transcriptional regulator [Planctomycetota bacterium]